MNVENQPTAQALAAKLQTVMPQRTMQLKKPTAVGLLTIIVGFVMLTLCAWGMFGSVKEILQDRKIAANPLPLHNAQIDGQCRSQRKLPILQSCDVQISHLGQVTEKSFSFLSFDRGDYQVYAVAQADNLDNISISLATEKLGARMWIPALLLGLALLGLMIFYGGIREKVRNRKLNRIFNAPAHQPWQFVALPLQREGNSVRFKQNLDGDSYSEVLSASQVAGKNAQALPLFLDDAHVLALQAKDTQSFVPLYEGLEVMQLTNAELQTIFQTWQNAVEQTSAQA